MEQGKHKKKVVIALGHRALGSTLPEQKAAVKKSAYGIADLIEEGCHIVISHSNAPQVGMIHAAMNEFGKVHQDYTVAPVSVCSAMSQGYIGYDLQNAIREELLRRGIFRTVSTILTQVLVNPYDEAFSRPVKVIGRYMNAEEAAAEEKKGNYVVEEPGMGFRRIVASPKPKDIIEIDAIRGLMDLGQIVIACGGGGIPVMKQDFGLKGASAIIEKDLASGKMAELLDADDLMILTSVEKVALNYQQPEETLLDTISVENARNYMENGHFAQDTMLPKFEAAVSFVSSGQNRRTIITSIEKAKYGYLGKTGTIIR